MTDVPVTLDTLRLLAPEIILVAAAVWTYIGGALRPRGGSWFVSGLFSILLAAAALYLQGRGSPEGVALSGPLLIEPFGGALRWLSLVAGGLLVLASFRMAGQRLACEYLGSLLLAIAGLMLTTVAGDLVLLFLALELISIPTYILLFLGRRDAAAEEATAKYFYLSILSSALLLYGFSFLYGIAGSTRLLEIRAAVIPLLAEGGGMAALVPLGLLLVFAGVGFKLAAVPFHFYAPDVYQGTTHGNAGVLAVLPKIAGIVTLVRLGITALPGTESIGWKLAFVVAVASMTLGNVLALWQQSVRRMLAYSSIAHAGYLMMGVAVSLAAPYAAPGGDGLAATLFYLLTYVLATAGAFAALAFAGGERDLRRVDDLDGLGRTHPLSGLALAVCMFSLAGIPPLAGFWGKLTLFVAALQVWQAELRPWFVALAVVGAVNAAIAAAYYLRIVGAIYFREPRRAAEPAGSPAPWLAAALAAVALLAVGLFPGRPLGVAGEASRAARGLPIASVDREPPAVPLDRPQLGGPPRSEPP